MSKITISDETVTKVQDSWEVVMQIPDCTQVVGELLFRNIFKIAPGAHKMFPFGKDYEKVEDKMFKCRHFKKHAKNVVGMLDSAVQFLGPDLSELEEVLINLGALHVGYGILPEHYPIVRQALLDTLALALKDDFTEDLKDAWAGVYGFITTSMLKGANESLLRYSVAVFGSNFEKKEMTLDEYVSSMLPGQTELYYITMTGDSDAGNFRDLEKLQHAKEMQKAGVAILHIAKNKQDVMATNLQKYLGRKMVDVSNKSNEIDTSFMKKQQDMIATNLQKILGRKMVDVSKKSSEIDTSFMKRVEEINASKEKDNQKNAPQENVPQSVSTLYKREGLTGEVATEFCTWFQNTLGEDKVKACTPTCEFASLPARVIQEETAAGGDEVQHVEAMSSLHVAKKHVEINPQHPLIVEINKARAHDAGLAQVLAAQVYDNCLINAGLLNDYRAMVTRINDLSLALLQEKNKSVVTTPVAATAASMVPMKDNSAGSRKRGPMFRRVSTRNVDDACPLEPEDRTVDTVPLGEGSHSSSNSNGQRQDKKGIMKNNQEEKEENNDHDDDSVTVFSMGLGSLMGSMGSSDSDDDGSIASEAESNYDLSSHGSLGSDSRRDLSHGPINADARC